VFFKLNEKQPVVFVRKDGFKLEGGVNCLKEFSQTFQS